MGKLVYSVITSLDGYVSDSGGNFDSLAPSEELHRFVNELERPVATYLYGRRLYEVMRFWETADAVGGETDAAGEYAPIWRAADKVVYSRTLEAVDTARTRIERAFDPGAVRAMKAAADRDLSVGGPELAAEAIRAGLVDEWHQFVIPVVLGGGRHWLPGGVRLRLELLDARSFADGAVHLHYRSAAQA